MQSGDRWRLCCAKRDHRASDAITTAIGHSNSLDITDADICLGISGGAAVMPQTIVALKNADVALASLTLARPSLDDVYLKHAGRSFKAADAAAKEAAQ